MRAWLTFAAIILLFLGLIAAFTYAETAQSDRLRNQDETAREPAATSLHTAKADCTTCHAAHSLSEKHTALPCAACHFAPDRTDELAESGATCAGCHPQAEEELPPLGVFRYPFSRNGTTNVDNLLPTTCADCHREEMTDRTLVTLTHPARSVGAHLPCRQCHDLIAGTLRPEVWARTDYAGDWCFSCHEEKRRSFALSDWHSLRQGDVSCVDCHPAHRPFSVNLTAESFQIIGARELLAYDPIESNGLCLRCHSYFELVNPDSAFSLGSGLSLHDLHLNRANAVCVECHQPHGGSENETLRTATLEGEALLHFATGDTGSCTVICHHKHHAGVQYLREGD